MNIHFKDFKLFEKLKSATLVKIKVGSHLYGNNNENSDEDFLYVYATSKEELNSVIQTNHQLQYKEEGIDHNFVSLHSFIKNIINGDSTINFEVIHSNELINTDLQWLHMLKNYFNTYTIKKSYNGLAKRDCKYFGKASTNEEKKKRLGHIIRGYIYCDMINDIFDFNKANKVFINTINKLETENSVNTQTVAIYKNLIIEQREELNNKLNNKTLNLAQNMYVENAIMLNQSLNIFMKSSIFKNKQVKFTNTDMKLFINAFENWVTYE